MTLRYFIYGIALSGFLFFAASLFFPSSYQVKTQVVINAPQEKVFKKIADLAEWKNWAFNQMGSSESAWKFKIAGKAGLNQSLSWEGEGGKGAIKQAFQSPFDSLSFSVSMNDGSFQAISTFRLHQTETKNNTLVIWEETGDFGWNPFARIFSVMAGLETQLSESYGESLLQLKNNVE